MIGILRNEAEIEKASLWLDDNALPRHSTRAKNWDLYHLSIAVRHLERSARIADLGCEGMCALNLLAAMGFRDIYGVDLSVDWRSRMGQLKSMIRYSAPEIPFHMYKRDILNSGFPDGYFDFASCISVIEHGIDAGAFFAEMRRILAPGAGLFVTADYWPERIEVSPDPRPYGLSWNVLDKKGVERNVDIASRAGFRLFGACDIPEAEERCASWYGVKFTFISMYFVREG